MAITRGHLKHWSIINSYSSASKYDSFQGKQQNPLCLQANLQISYGIYGPDKSCFCDSKEMLNKEIVYL